MQLRSIFWSACALLAVMSTAAHAAITVTPMSFVPETIAGDGSAVFGIGTRQLKRWTPDGGGTTTTLGTFSATAAPHVFSTSDDGSVVVGFLSDFNSFIGRKPWIWTASGGIQIINYESQIIFRVYVSGDGQRVVG